MSLALAGALLYLRSLASAPEPVFTIEHEIEIDAPLQDVWDVLTAFDTYGEWNPYVLRLEGDLEPGQPFALQITQANWAKPLTLHPTLVALDPTRGLAWHGTAVVTGFLETDHSLRLEAIDANRTRLRHAEEFRGWLAYRMNHEKHHQHTRTAFRAMNEALAARVVATR